MRNSTINAGASAMMSKESVLSGILQAIFRAHLYRLKQVWSEYFVFFFKIICLLFKTRFSEIEFTI